MTRSTVEIRIRGYWPPSPNARLHRHWSTVRRHKRDAMDRLKVACLHQLGRVPRFAAPVEVNLVRCWGRRGRAMDADNLVGSVKPLIDAMRAERRRMVRSGFAGTRAVAEGGLGIIPDDDPASLTLTVEQVRNTAPDRETWTLIRIRGERLDPKPSVVDAAKEPPK